MTLAQQRAAYRLAAPQPVQHVAYHPRLEVADRVAVARALRVVQPVEPAHRGPDEELVAQALQRSLGAPAGSLVDVDALAGAGHHAGGDHDPRAALAEV
ncbi:MAG: hypothetical protein ACK559_28895, partial [bacterium]